MGLGVAKGLNSGLARCFFHAITGKSQPSRQENTAATPWKSTMSQVAILLLTLLLLVPLWVLLRRDFIHGLCYAVFLCVTMPTELRIPLPGSLPQLTIYRLVLIVVFLFWLRHRDRGQKLSDAPLFLVFMFWAVANLVSVVLTSGVFVSSLKRYLDFVVEAAVFFILMVTSLRDRQDALRVLRAACLGLVLVAALAFVEKYTAFNPVNYLYPDVEDVPQSQWRDVIVTYRHRILLGTGMAVAFPLVLVMMLKSVTGFRRSAFGWLSLALVLAGCYFADSRGPWLAAALAGGVLMVLGKLAIRRKLTVIFVLATLVLVARPGVVQTLVRSAEITGDAQSLKGGNFRYRLELWKVAWSEISGSPNRLLFGCGPGSGLGTTVDWNLSYRGGQREEIWSWDNQLAYDLYQSGVVGFAASVSLYGSLLLAVYRSWRGVSPEDKPLMACLLASIVAYEFMLTNVMMFTKPVNFLFWTVAAVYYTIALNPQRQEQAILEKVDSAGAAPSSVGPPLSGTSEFVVS